MEKEEILNRAQQGKDDEYQQAIENRALIAGTAAAAIAMAVIYMITTLVWLLLALRFVNPTQIVARAKQSNN